MRERLGLQPYYLMTMQTYVTDGKILQQLADNFVVLF